MALRPILPRLKQLSSLSGLSRRGFCSRRNRDLPIWSPWHDPWPTSLARGLMDRPFSPFMPSWMQEQFKEMDKMVNRLMPRWWDEPYIRSSMSAKEMDVKYDNKVFEVRLDVSKFNPGDIEVKISDDRLVVSAKHKEKQDDHGYISREFTRQILIPENVEEETLKSMLTKDGYLVINAKVKGAENVKERVINIEKEETDPKKE